MRAFLKNKLVIDFFVGHKVMATIDPYLKETEFYEKRANIWIMLNLKSFK